MLGGTTGREKGGKHWSHDREADNCALKGTSLRAGGAACKQLQQAAEDCTRMDQAILTRFRTRSTTTERPKATATKTRAKPPSTASSPRTPRTRRTRSPTSTSRTSRTRPAELRPEHPALVPGPPLLQPGGLALLPAPLQGQVRSGHLGANPDRYRFIPVRGTTPRRTGTTPKRTARPRPSSTSSTSPGTRPRPSASSSGAPRTPPKQTCAKGQRDPETERGTQRHP